MLFSISLFYWSFGWVGLVVGRFGLSRENEKGRWDFPAASVRILDVGVTYVSDSLSRWGERLVFTAAKPAAI